MNYFTEQFEADKREIEGIDNLLRQVWRTLASCITDDGFWPYELSNGEPVAVEKLSVSTQSMVHYALGVASGQICCHEFTVKPPQGRTVPSAPKLPKEIKSQVTNALVRSSVALEQEDDMSATIAKGIFGKNNPFALCWLLPISVSKPAFFEKIKQLARDSLATVKRNDDGSLLVISRNPDYELTTHAFPVLRALQLLKMTYPDAAQIPPEVRKTFEPIALGDWFYSRLLDHIAFAHIKDGPFDAAELAFSLEGYLLCRPRLDDGCNHDRDAIDSAFQILESRQEVTPYWRPLKPLLTNKKGFALLPLSVEIVNSLFRSCWLLGSRGDRLFDNHVKIFHRYHEWVESRLTEGESKHPENPQKDFKFQGWYSEHLASKEGIHTWETSQVGIYLVHYRNMLQRHVGTKSLENAGLSRKKISRKSHHELSPTHYWNQVVTKFSPRQPGDDDVYTKIESSFIAPRMAGAKDSKPKFSAILYGPPGTGKTSLAEAIAASLGWDFIALSPSHFIDTGVSQVEQRAKRIFDALCEQENCVILLDEIDRLILDRNSKAYGTQDDMFQMMTPSMLPKLKALRSREASIFVIGTNYYERIEAAAIRVGRVDVPLLVGLPDFESRCRILKQQLSDDPFHKELVEIIVQDAEVVADIAARTPLASFSEIEQIVLRISETMSQTDNVNLELFKTCSRKCIDETILDVRIDNYVSRLSDLNYSSRPIAELLDLIWLLYETDDVAKKLSSLQKDSINRLLELLLTEAGYAGNTNAEMAAALRETAEKNPWYIASRVKVQRIASVLEAMNND
jgi:DNA polymerase III delta prime subunit